MTDHKKKFLIPATGLILAIMNFAAHAITVDPVQVSEASTAAPIDQSRNQDLMDQIIEQAEALSACKKTSGYKLMSISAHMSDMRVFIRQRLQFINDVNDKREKNSSQDQTEIVDATNQIRVMQDEMESLFTEYKALGGTEHAASAVVMRTNPCSEVAKDLRAKLKPLLKSPSQDNPNFAKVKIQSDSCHVEYPKISMSNGQTGPVELLMFATSDGNVIYAEIAKSTGYRLLDYAAIDMAYSCKVVPFAESDQAKLALVTIKFVYELSN